MNSTAEPSLDAIGKRYDALILISQALRQHADLNDLFRVLTAELGQVIAFDGILITRNDAQTSEVIWRASEILGQSPDAAADQATDKLATWIYEQQRPVTLASLAGEPQFQEMISVVRGLGVCSACMFPLTTAHRRLGSLGFASLREDDFSEEDLRFLGLVAGQVALAMDDALHLAEANAAQARWKESSDRLELLLRINNAVVSNLELRKVFDAISANIREVMKCDLVGLLLAGADGRTLQGFALDFPGSQGFLDEHTPVPAYLQELFDSGEPVAALTAENSMFDRIAREEAIVSGCFLPLEGHNRRKLGLLGIGRRESRRFSAQELQLLQEIAKQIAISIENALAYRKIAELQEQLARENIYLENEIRSELNFEEIVGRSPALTRVLKQLEVVAPTDSTVIIYGETGTGKELIARALHKLSERSGKAFVKLNCAAIPTGLLESELFGHERGAFTGAVAQRIGRFELADRGTVFLDEIGEIPLELQPKLLRVLQEQEFERLGSSRTLRTNTRLIAATNRELSVMVNEQTFRADLYYRLNVFPLYIPALRERPDDIPLLVRHFVQHFARRMNKTVDTIPSETMNALVRYRWPGNIRELQNLIERAIILSPTPVLHVPLGELQTAPVASVPVLSDSVETLAKIERQHILRALDASRWIIAGPNGAAAALGLKRTTLQARMEKLEIRRARAAE